MKNQSWNDIEKGLRAQPKPVTTRDAQSFWAEFRARADLAGQSRPAVLELPRRRHTLQWAMAAAAALVLLVGVFLLNQPATDATIDQVPHNKIAMLGGNQVKSLNVYAENSGYFVLQGDENNGTNGTIVWIAGLEPEVDKKDSP